MATSQTEEATDNKQDSEESGAVQESGGENSEPQAPAKEAAAEQVVEETQEQKAADDKADSKGSGAAQETEVESQVVELSAEAEVRAEAEAKAKAEAEEEEKAKAEAEERANIEAEDKAKAKAETEKETKAGEDVKAEAEEKTEAEIEAKPEAEAVEEKGKPEAKVESKEKAEAVEEKTEAKAEAAEEPKAEAEEKAKPEVEVKPEAEAVEEKGKPEAEAKVEAEEKAKTENESKAKAETKAEEKAKTEAKAEEKAETETEAKPEGEAVEKEGKPEAKVEAEEEVEEKTESKAAEEKGKPEAEAKVELDTGYSIPDTRRESSIDPPTAGFDRNPALLGRVSSSVPDQSQESATGEISETIQKMTQSPAVLPGESGKPTAKIHISVSSGVCAKDIMQKEVVWANSEESVQQALTKMQQQDSGYIMIGKDGTLEGIVSKSDITGAASIYLRPIFAKWHGPLDDATLQIKIKWIMSRPVRTVRPETPLATIIENMCRFGGRGLPVMDEQGKVQGLVTVFDIFRTLLNTSEDASAVGKTAEAPALA